MEEHSVRDNSKENPEGPQFDPKIEIKQVEKETPDENYKNEDELKDSNKRQRIDENSAAAVLALKDASSLNTLAEATNTGKLSTPLNELKDLIFFVTVYLFKLLFKDSFS